MLKKQKGITLIALIITIIVMLILVGVTINVALNGGLFSKAEEATAKTKITQIKEALTIKRGEVLADYKGKTPEDYGIELKDLNLPEELKTEYGSKLIISADGKLYYNATTVTNAEEQNQFREMGIEEHVETNTTELYSFTLNEMDKEGAFIKATDGFVYDATKFWDAVGAEEDLQGKFGLNASNGKLIGEMSTNSENLKFYGTNQTEGGYLFYLMEAYIDDLQKNVVVIGFFQITDGKEVAPDFGEEYTDMLSKLGNIEIYFGVK